MGFLDGYLKQLTGEDGVDLLLLSRNNRVISASVNSEQLRTLPMSDTPFGPLFDRLLKDMGSVIVAPETHSTEKNKQGNCKEQENIHQKITKQKKKAKKIVKDKTKQKENKKEKNEKKR